jgi:hypothetical protein
MNNPIQILGIISFFVLGFYMYKMVEVLVPVVSLKRQIKNNTVDDLDLFSYDFLLMDLKQIIINRIFPLFAVLIISILIK